MSLSTLSVDLGFVTLAALETTRLAADSKALKLNVDVIQGHHFVVGDATRLQQVVWNLLSNAVKFTPPGGQVTIQLSQTENVVQLQVQDKGEGIDPTFLPYVFDYFRQEDSSSTRRFGGLGLGLAIVRQIVELHGGTVHASSPGEGQGATFTVSLPLVQPTTPKLAEAERTAPVAELNGVRILVVDDEPDSLSLVAFLLRQAGAIVETMSSARDALTAFTRFKPHVLVSDIGMPEIDGYKLMRLVKAMQSAQKNTIPAIALTAYAGEYDQQQAMNAGFRQHISKPADPDKLIQAIATLVKLG